MSIVYDRKIFFDTVRAPVFHGLSDAQVAGSAALLAEAERRQMTEIRFLAYILATAFWESGRTMQPVCEIGRGRGKSYGIADPQTHQTYYGRGLVQLTWKANYAKLSTVCGMDLVHNPDLALRLDVAITILFEGMGRGLFTGKKLSDFFHGEATDWVGARAIVNGSDQAEAIAAIARQFSTALRSAGGVVAGPALAAAAPMPAPVPSLASRLKTLFGLLT